MTVTETRTVAFGLGDVEGKIIDMKANFKVFKEAQNNLHSLGRLHHGGDDIVV